MQVVGIYFGRTGQPFFADTDDAMRMVRMRDFLAGQGWYDHVAHRLNTPWGAEIHWSRLIDLPLALLMLVFTPLLGADAAMVAAGYVWPMLLLGALLWLGARLAWRLVGPDGVLPAIMLPVLSPAITAEFNPGRVDHHNVVILLTLAITWTGIEAIRRPRFAILCGLLCATALAIAIESLPTIAAAILVAGLAWVFDPARAAAMRGLGIAFAIGSVAHLALYRPPSRWFEAACDVLSPVYVGVALAVAAAFAVASLVPPPPSRWLRLLLLGVLGFLGMGAVVLAYPKCLSGPYGELDPWLQANWIASIVEARPWTSSVFDVPALGVAVGAPVLLGALVALYRLWRVPEDRLEWAALLVFLLCAAVVMLAQVRGARLAVMPAMPAAAWLIVAARRRYLAAPALVNGAGLVVAWLMFSGVVLWLLISVLVTLVPGRAQQVAKARASEARCLLPAAFASLPPTSTRIISPIDLGAHLLLYTPHEVVAAPYHRNEQGVRDAFRFFNDPIAEARAVLDARGIGLVVICPAMAELRGIPARAKDSFVNLRAAGTLPAWLEDVSLPDSPLEVYAVRRQ